MSYIDSAQCVQCHAIIHSASVSAGAIGAGLAQIPCSDNAVIAPIQIAMTIALGRVFGLELSDSAARATLVSVAGTTTVLLSLFGTLVHNRKRLYLSTRVTRTAVSLLPRTVSPSQ